MCAPFAMRAQQPLSGLISHRAQGPKHRRPQRYDHRGAKLHLYRLRPNVGRLAEYSAFQLQLHPLVERESQRGYNQSAWDCAGSERRNFRDLLRRWQLCRHGTFDGCAVAANHESRMRPSALRAAQWKQRIGLQLHVYGRTRRPAVYLVGFSGIVAGWASLNASTGALTGTAATGTTSFTIQVCDANSDCGTLAVTLTVAASLSCEPPNYCAYTGEALVLWPAVPTWAAC